MFILYILLSLMVIGSVIAVETRDLLSSVVSVGAVGFCLSIVFLILGAPDLAIIQVVVEVLCLLILLRATVTRDDTTIAKHIETFAVASVLVFFGVFMAFAYYIFRDFPPFGQPLMTVSGEYVRTGLAKTGAANIVTAVLLDFRGYDTLGEATVIFVSIVGALTVLRRRGRKRAQSEQAGDKE